jgi:hypothetical protein
VHDVTNSRQQRLCQFGFTFHHGGTHLARTIMLSELTTLLSYVEEVDAPLSEYKNAIYDDNCLQKRSGKTRLLTYQHLVSLYALDPKYVVFRALRYFWERDPAGYPLLAFLTAYARDSILSSTAPFFLKIPQSTLIPKVTLEEYIDKQSPGRFNQTTLQSTTRNIFSSWSQSGHVTGHVEKYRAQAIPSPGSVSLALLFGYLSGARGENLFHSEFANLLDCSFEVAVDLATDASKRGWIVMKRVGTIIEVLFPNLLTSKDMELLHEQD